MCVKVKPIKLIKNLPLSNCIVKVGDQIDGIKINDQYYKVFHHTGWWQVSSEYFE